MPLYLGRFSYSTDAIRGLVENPHDRAKARSIARRPIRGCSIT